MDEVSMLVFIDESGDLGFDLFKAGASSHFVIAAVVLPNHSDRKKFENGVRRTLKNKINGGKGKNNECELKGSKTSISVKKYFWNQVKDLNFCIYSFSIEKQIVPPTLT
jgi:hypothetical protein